MDRSCCFCGRRTIPAGELPLLEQRLGEEIARLAGRGVTRFLTGGAPGFDTLAARAVLRARGSPDPARKIMKIPAFSVQPRKKQVFFSAGCRITPAGGKSFWGK